MTHNAAAPYLERRAKNLNFFAKNYPGIYNYFKDYQFKTLKLDIRVDDDEVDFIVNGGHVYGGFGKRYAKQESSKFNEIFKPGSRVRSVVPITKGEYTNPRFFASKVKELYDYSPLQLNSSADFKGYFTPEFLPLVVCLGVGLGLHILELLNIRDVHHLVIVEHDPDRFAASLYTVEWWKIVNRQRERPGRSIDFVLLHNVTEWQDVRASVWNKLIERCPMFPVTTYMYNHCADPRYDKVASDINRDIYMHLFSFGNYDDEVNQLNNAIHNFLRPIPKVGKAKDVDLASLGRTGVCIVGSGPSLDGRIDDLRVLAKKALVISCGTAIGALLKHGVVPDFHVELESDYLTYRVQSENADLEALKRVRILGAAQLSPLLFELFGEKRLFFKAESPLSELFGDADERIIDAAPTCTNAALAIANHYGFTEAYLFGLDYGFPSAAEHHAKGTLYYDENACASVSATLEDETIEIEAANGGKILSTTFLYTSLRRTENIVITLARTCAVYNFSDGARIDRAKWVPSGEGGHFLTPLNDVKGSVLDKLFSSSPVQVRDIQIAKQSAKLQKFVMDLSRKLIGILKSPILDLAQMTVVCFRINQYLHEKVLTESTAYYYFTRGAIWHFLHAGYSHAYALTNEMERKLWMEWWQDRFIAFLDAWPEHLSGVISKDFGQPDPWLHRSIRNPESEGIRPGVFFNTTKWVATGFEYNEKAGFRSIETAQEVTQ